MLYVDKTFYTALYGEIDDTEFNRLCWAACRKLDMLTTGVDGVKKLRTAFPSDADNAEIVKRCVCDLIHLMRQIGSAEMTANQARGYTKTANGLQGKVISSVSAGNETISYVTGSAGITTWIDKAVADKMFREKLFADTITEELSGVADVNGVNLLYMGPYPH